MNNKIGIIGFGNMGSTIAEKINSQYSVIVFDKDISKTKGLTDIQVAVDILNLVNSVDVVILAVKPQDFEELLKVIKPHVKDKLVVSIAAGRTTDFISSYLPESRIIRTMPNLLAKIGEGITFLFLGKGADSKDLNLAREIFDKLGKTWIIETDETRMDSATACSGTSPALACYFIEKQEMDSHTMSENQKKELIEYLAKGIEANSFTKTEAITLAEDITNGVIHMLDETGLTPAQLREKITSKGGTTAAALQVLNAGGTIEEALKAAVQRAKQLSGS